VGDGAARNRIALHSSTLGSGAVIKHLHYVEYEDMPLVFNNVRLLVLPSHSEGLPNVVIEAMACGTPVLATDVGAIPDIIEDGDNGFLLKSSDPNLIAERITGLLGDPSRLESVGANASSFIERRFSLEATRATWRTLFSAVCPSDPAKIASSKPQDSR
jgi:glycosyltransferase involved in cell wall biosynthesis